MKNKTNSLDMKQMQKNAAAAELLLKQLANANRLMVLCHLFSGEKTVGELSKNVFLSQSALSQHLAKLREAGLVSSDKRGLSVYYRICSMEAQALLSVLHLIYCRKA
jgi:DNA-binding transcriptional ArsR family regulator